MKWILLLALLLTCNTPKPLVDTDFDKLNVRTRVKIKGDSNRIEVNYYIYRNDTIRRDSI